MVFFLGQWNEENGLPRFSVESCPMKPKNLTKLSKDVLYLKKDVQSCSNAQEGCSMMFKDDSFIPQIENSGFFG
jgi:hypothetical protein